MFPLTTLVERALFRILWAYKAPMVHCEIYCLHLEILNIEIHWHYLKLYFLGWTCTQDDDDNIFWKEDARKEKEACTWMMRRLAFDSKWVLLFQMLTCTEFLEWRLACLRSAHCLKKHYTRELVRECCTRLFDQSTWSDKYEVLLPIAFICVVIWGILWVGKKSFIVELLIHQAVLWWYGGVHQVYLSLHARTLVV